MVNNKVALLGFGVVGKAFYDIVKNKKFGGDDIDIKFIYVRAGKADGYNKDYDTDIFTSDINKIINSDISTIVECMVYNDEVYKIIKSTLEAGKNLVSSNKKLLGLHYKEYIDICKTTHSKMYYEASAQGGINIFHELYELKQCDKIISFDGIVNGTTNYMLSLMNKENMSFDEALRDAQRRGFAELDPSSDIDGEDAQYKLSILNIFLNKKYVYYKNIPAIGIRYIRKEDLEYAKKNNKVIKLIGHIDNDIVYFIPTLLQKETFIAHVDDNLNFARVMSENLGVSTYIGAGAGGAPTAKSLIMDLQSSFKNNIDYNVVPTDMDIDLKKEFVFYVNDNGNVSHKSMTLEEVINLKKENLFIMKEE